MNEDTTLLRIAEVIERVDGLSREALHYWEDRGYIQAKQVSWGERKVRSYSPRQLKKIKLMQNYTSIGSSPSEASEKADNIMDNLEIGSFDNRGTLEEGDKIDLDQFLERRANTYPSGDSVSLLHAPILNLDFKKPGRRLIKEDLFQLSIEEVFPIALQVFNILKKIKPEVDFALPCDWSTCYLTGYLSAISHQAGENIPIFKTRDFLEEVKDEGRFRIALLSDEASKGKAVVEEAKELEEMNHMIVEIIALCRSEDQLGQLMSGPFPTSVICTWKSSKG